uniref:Nucleoporin Nup159/Nup146 N-terminal domain-containing protein n=1 Tax=Timema douglasi TaxID=61478 RepID=A0A7R8W0F3_TIMDO|nr:unnamed protein product [Timema douglasi]
MAVPGIETETLSSAGRHATDWFKVSNQHYIKYEGKKIREEQITETADNLYVTCDMWRVPPFSCFSWSPKGKQLVVGDSNGALTQYKPDLKAVKVLPAPSLGGNPVAVVNVVWLSNYQFAAVYQDKLNSMEKPCLLIVNAPKTSDVTFVNYEDICYSSGETRSPQFYLIHQPSWNVLLAASANSMELGVLGLASDQVSWMQWVLEDASRAELPLNSATREETYPVGVGLDTSTQHELPWGEGGWKKGKT